jgi:hypothetical protein
MARAGSAAQSLLYETGYFLDSTGNRNGHCGSLGRINYAMFDGPTALRTMEMHYAFSPGQVVFLRARARNEAIRTPIVIVQLDRYVPVPILFTTTILFISLPCSRNTPLRSE